MSKAFYPKLAWNGICKNKKLYLPYILTCVGMVTMQYIIGCLADSPLLTEMRGGRTTAAMLYLGSWVIGIFSLIFLFYTSSFLNRRRRKEFGLYNILGMGKRNIARILIWETLITAGISLAGGFAAGILLSKLAELGLVNILCSEASLGFYISWKVLLITAALFVAIFLLIFIKTLLQVRFSNPIALLHSENTGEKPPKANWFLAALGAVILGAAYWMAISIEAPLAALNWFFVAVIMVIIATYLLFVAGSVVMCRILQKNKRYYYKSAHFVSVSSMAYRMKRNGAGLASICILATMVLVIVSSTTSLYFGTEDSLLNRYPREINVMLDLTGSDGTIESNLSAIRQELEKTAAESGAAITDTLEYTVVRGAGKLNGTELSVDCRYEDELSDDIYNVRFLSAADLGRLAGEEIFLGENEIMTVGLDSPVETLTVNGTTYTVKKGSPALPEGITAMEIIHSLYIIVPDLDKAAAALGSREEIGYIENNWVFGFNTGADTETQIAVSENVWNKLHELSYDGAYGINGYSFGGRAENSNDFYGTYGGLFFLGIILSIVFVFAAVLIIYYKQISEGYEDGARFEIMRKVGMTKREIRRSINSQLLTVFFLPLIGAGAHLLCAFPMIQKLLYLFDLRNVFLFAMTSVISFLVFALFYTLVYRLTSNAYFNIVSGAKSASD